jgi:hypothetical protein
LEKIIYIIKLKKFLIIERRIKKKRMNKFNRLFVLSILLVVFLSVTVLAVEPFGANVVNVSSVRAIPDNATNNDAMAGNVSEITVNGYTITQAWQGYFGNVSGTIQLADSSDNVMYNWSLASPEGEIYASTNNSIIWNYIQCLNFDAAGTYADVGTGGVPGGTNLLGTNLTLLDDMFGIDVGDVDAPNNTFSLLGTHESGKGLTHDLFYTNNFEFSAGECLSTHIFGVNKSASDSTFQEVLLYEPTTRSVVFTSILDEESPLGFDARSHDFEMLVLENGHLTDTTSTPYYFWVELE